MDNFVNFYKTLLRISLLNIQNRALFTGFASGLFRLNVQQTKFNKNKLIPVNNSPNDLSAKISNRFDW